MPPAGYSIDFLRNVSGLKRAVAFITPLQQMLSLSPVKDDGHDVVMEKCKTCQKDIPLVELQQHLTICKKPNKESTNFTDESSDADGTMEEACPPEVLSPDHIDLDSDDSDDAENGMLSLAIQQSLEERQMNESLDTAVLGSSASSLSPVVVCIDNEPPLLLQEPFQQIEDVEPELNTVLRLLSSEVDRAESPFANCINVVRDSVMECSLRAFGRRRFDPTKKINVVFVDNASVGEGSIDDGGPTREYLRLLMKEVHNSRLFVGPDTARNLALVSHAIQTEEYHRVGQMIAVCLVHGGVLPKFFSDRLYAQVCGQPTPPVSLQEIDDWEFKEKLQKIKDTKSVEEAREAIQEASDSLSLLGALCHVSSLDERDELVNSASGFYIEGRVQAGLQQFLAGLETLGLLKALRKHPLLMKTLFVGQEKPLEASELTALFEPMLSSEGSNKRRDENRSIAFWRDWLLDVEDGNSTVSLEQILIFASGASRIPPLGFPFDPTLEFLHTSEGTQKIFPEANTCLVVVRLPIHPTYEKFKHMMESGIVQSPTFGLP
ncbi:hypothetical protein SKAU_G00021160 [Synaphobranchus kaupii]|uniref:HECT-type E3 ubiquitin transferase n=1 Tax=Synaphobranchus kaupii TaxID=118154 RepID=A0A9Q1GCV8_SYNKA|nr:hypothetical protein SKAU_G00021160 [Synaphobranchus kaupii]